MIVAREVGALLQHEGTPHQEVSLTEDGVLQFFSSSESAPQTSVPLRRRVSSAVAAAFLPAAFPDSVTPDYLPFQAWDTVQGLCSYVRGMLSTQAMLEAVGVGSAAATPAAAALTFFFRDAVGLIAGVLFAALQGSSFDAYAKQWRLAADVANDLGLVAELAAPFFPNAFLLLACFGSVARTVTGVAGGATRMALTQHFALRGNAADIAAKEGSQETAVTLVGMVLGLGLTRLATRSAVAAWAAFFALTWVHVWANVKAMRCLRVARLNPARLDLILAQWVATAKVPTPAEVAPLESLVPPPLAAALGLKEAAVDVAPALSSWAAGARSAVGLCLACNSRELAAPATEKHFIVVEVGSGKRRSAVVLLAPEASPIEDVVVGYCVGRLLMRGRPDAWALRGGSEAFLAALQGAGWAMDTKNRPALLQGSSRVRWGPKLAAESEEKETKKKKL